MVILTVNPFMPFEDLPNAEKYGIFSRPMENPMKDGSRLEVTLKNKVNSVTIIDHWYSSQTYEKVAQQVGFRDCSWHSLRLPEGKDPVYWKEMLEN